MEPFLEKISKIMTRDVFTINSNATISKALPIMRDYDISVLPVISGRRIIGLISRLHILEAGITPNTKVGSIAEPAPNLSLDTLILDAAKMLVSHKFEALPVLDNNGNLAGIVARYDIVKYALEKKWLDKFKVRDVMSINLVTASPSDSIGKVRKLIMNHAIRQIPIVDNGKLIGIVSIRDILERVYSITLRRSTVGEFVGETESIFSRPVKSIMSRPVFTVNVNDKLSEAGRIMIEKGFFSTPVVDKSSVVGIITRGDIVRLIAALILEISLPLSFKGLENLPPHLIGLANTSVSRTFDRIARTVDLFEGSVVIKKQREAGLRNIYFVEVSAETARGVFTASEKGWEPIQSLNSALRLLERQVEKELAKKREAKRKTRFPPLLLLL